MPSKEYANKPTNHTGAIWCCVSKFHVLPSFVMTRKKKIRKCNTPPFFGSKRSVMLVFFFFFYFYFYYLVNGFKILEFGMWLWNLKHPRREYFSKPNNALSRIIFRKLAMVHSSYKISKLKLQKGEENDSLILPV